MTVSWYQTTQGPQDSGEEAHDMRLTLFLIVAICSITGAFARDNGQYADVPDHIRKWFNEQISPENGRSCCSIADGNETQEQIRDGQYWVLIEGKWFPVPPSRVIHNKGNPVGRPVVWYQKFPPPNDDDAPAIPEINILCFVPGARI
jgi:hypothetical protein